MAFKKASIALVSLLAISSLHAQVFDKWKGKNVEKLYNQTIHVKLGKEGPFFNRMNTAFETYWKVTPFEIHGGSKGYKAIPPSSSVFEPAMITLSKKRGSGSSTNMFSHPFFVFGEANEYGGISGEGIVAAFPINAFHYEFDVRSDSMYSGSILRLPYMVKTLDEMLTHLKENKTEKDFFNTVDARSSTIAKKTLIIPADLTKEWDVNPNTTAFMKSSIEAGKKKMKPINHSILEADGIGFNGKFKIMSNEEIMKLEQSKDASKYSIFLPAIDDHQYIMVFDLATKELLYYEMDKMGMRIKSKDFDKLNKAAGL